MWTSESTWTPYMQYEHTHTHMKNTHIHTHPATETHSYRNIAQSFIILMDKCIHTRMHTSIMQMTLWMILTNFTRGQCCLIKKQGQIIQPLSSPHIHLIMVIFLWAHSTVTLSFLSLTILLKLSNFLLLMMITDLFFSLLLCKILWVLFPFQTLLFQMYWKD